MNINDFAAWLPVADAVLKSTLLIAAAGVASFAMRRASAASRHLVWLLALCSALALPVLSTALPRWEVPLVTLEKDAAATAVDHTALQPPALPAPLNRTTVTAPSPSTSSAQQPKTVGSTRSPTDTRRTPRETRAVPDAASVAEHPGRPTPPAGHTRRGG